MIGKRKNGLGEGGGYHGNNKARAKAAAVMMDAGTVTPGPTCDDGAGAAAAAMMVRVPTNPTRTCSRLNNRPIICRRS